MHVSLVTLGVADLERSLAYYTSLGWRRSTASVEGTVAFLEGTPVLALFGHSDLADDAGVEAEPPPAFRGMSLATNLPSEAAVDELMATAEAAGARVVKRAEPTEWGGYAGYVADPDGHLWEFAYNPGFGLAPDGTIRLP